MELSSTDYLAALHQAVPVVMVALRYADSLEEAKALVLKHSFTGETDPGQWWPEAQVIIHAEANGIPDGDDLGFWEEVDAELVRMGLQQFYCQPVNQIILAFIYDPDAMIQEPRPAKIAEPHPHLRLVH